MNLTTLSRNSRNLHFRIDSIIYYTTNFCKICYRAKPLRHETTVHQGATVLEGKEINSYITKMLTFPTSGTLLRDKQFEFRKNNFILLILAYSGSRACLYLHTPMSTLR